MCFNTEEQTKGMKKRKFIFSKPVSLTFIILMDIAHKLGCRVWREMMFLGYLILVRYAFDIKKLHCIKQKLKPHHTKVRKNEE